MTNATKKPDDENSWRELLRALPLWFYLALLSPVVVGIVMAFVDD